MEENCEGNLNGQCQTQEEVIQNLDNFSSNGNDTLTLPDESALNIENENYLPGSELLQAEDPAGWDILLSHGGAVATNTKWERESLYQKFDPLVSRTERNDFTAQHQSVNPRILAVKGESAEDFPANTSATLISLGTPPPCHNGTFTRSISPNEPDPIFEDPAEDPAIPVDEPHADSSPQVANETITIHAEDVPLGSYTPNYSDGTYSVHSSDAETDHSETNNDGNEVSADTTFIKPSNITRVPKSRSTNSASSSTDDHISDRYNGKEFVSELQKVNQEICNETFITSDFSSALTNVEWDLLVDRGTGSNSVSTKWDRESLAQRFDPLVSLREQQDRMRTNTVVNRLGSSEEDSKCDVIPRSPLLPESKLISIDTPPHSKIRGKMTIRSETGDYEDSEAISEFAEPQHEFSEDGALAESALSSDDLEIKKLKQQLEVQAKNFQEQMNQRSLKLKEIEAAITAASKKLDSHQQSNRVLKEYEKSIVNLEAEIDRIKRQISKTELERKKIAEERDFASDDLRQAEVAFSDLHNKYERVKLLIGNFKRNEDILVNRYDLMKVKLHNRDAQLKRLNEAAEEVMNRMKNDYESRIKAEDLEGNRLRAQIRKLELRLSTIEKDLEQKAKENSQLSHLCDDLIKGQRN